MYVAGGWPEDIEKIVRLALKHKFLAQVDKADRGESQMNTGSANKRGHALRGHIDERSPESLRNKNRARIEVMAKKYKDSKDRYFTSHQDAWDNDDNGHQLNPPLGPWLPPYAIRAAGFGWPYDLNDPVGTWPLDSLEFHINSFVYKNPRYVDELEKTRDEDLPDLDVDGSLGRDFIISYYRANGHAGPGNGSTIEASRLHY